MKRNEKGFTLLELVVAITIIALTSTAAAMAIFQIYKVTERNNDNINAVRQVQNAGYWISRDAQMAQTISADNLTLPNFLILNWTEWDAQDEPIYHSATYFFEDLSNGVGRLKRTHWSSTGADEQTLIANYIYYNLGNPDDSSKASYQNPVLTVQLTAFFEDSMETLEYRISHRPNL